MIVIKSIYNRFSGSGLIGNLFKKITKDRVKDVIKQAASSSIAHKVKNAVVKGAVAATEKVVENAIVDNLKKRPLSPPSDSSQLTKRQKIENIINSGSGLEKVVEKAIIENLNHPKKRKIGSGIVLD